MSNTFAGDGNLGGAPTLRHVTVGGEQKMVCDLNIFFDNYRPDGKDGFVESGGFWLRGSIWGKRAESAVKLLAKGARVHAVGRLVQDTFKDKNGEDDSEMRLQLDDIYLSTQRVESVQFAEKRGKPESAPKEAMAA